MSDITRTGAPFSIPEKYFRECALIETREFIKSASDKAVIFVEPHPDDAILGAGGFLQLILQEKEKSCLTCCTSLITASSGSHAIADEFVRMLSGTERQEILLKYEKCFAWFLSAAENTKDEKEYYFQCVKNIKALQRQPKNEKLYESVVKGGIRTFLETERALKAFGKEQPIDHYAAFLAFYDPLIGGKVDIRHPANEFAIKTVIREIMRRAGVRKIVLFNDCGVDPHGTHAWVRRILDKAIAALVEKDEIVEVSYFWMRGPWPMMQLRGGEKMCAVPLSKECIDKKEQVLREYVSQREPLVTDGEVKYFTVRVKENNFTFAQKIKNKANPPCSLDDHAEIFFVRTFMNNRGQFDKNALRTYVKEGTQ
jgi:LmbE family N-acetylglucosaminyl deacetylase